MAGIVQKIVIYGIAFLALEIVGTALSQIWVARDPAERSEEAFTLSLLVLSSSALLTIGAFIALEVFHV